MPKKESFFFWLFIFINILRQKSKVLSKIKTSIKHPNFYQKYKLPSKIQILILKTKYRNFRRKKTLPFPTISLHQIIYVPAIRSDAEFVNFSVDLFINSLNLFSLLQFVLDIYFKFFCFDSINFLCVKRASARILSHAGRTTKHQRSHQRSHGWLRNVYFKFTDILRKTGK